LAREVGRSNIDNFVQHKFYDYHSMEYAKTQKARVYIFQWA
jgi:hypothetical protein